MLDKIDHIGIAVRDLDAAEKIYTDLLGLPPYNREKVASEKVVVSFFRVSESKIELLAATEPDSFIAKFIERHGEGIHHVAYAVAKISHERDRLKSLGFRPLSKEPKAGADNKWVMFLHPKDTLGTLVELCEERESGIQETQQSL